MAYDYNKIKTAYEALNDTQKQQFAQQTGGNVQQFLKDYQAEQAKASTPKTSTTSTNVAKPEYQGSGTTGTKTSTYTNQGEGDYYYNPQTQYYEKKATSAGTTEGTTGGTTGGTPSTPKTGTTGTTPDLAKFWNDLSYQQQQDYFNKNPNLKQSVVAKGLTIKSKPAETTTTEGGETPKQGEWDYQDNSPERMKQMADNVNQFYASDPWIFNSEDSFRKFFIDGKGRTKEQEQFLMDLYKNREKYNELDGYTADKVGSMDAHGQIPSGYLTYLKNTDPERYAVVMDAKAKEEDKIKDNAALDTINSMNGDSKDTTTAKAIEWLKSQGLFIDEDGNFIDDRTENYATEEEKQYAKNAADIIARNLEIDNIVKHSYDDLVERYPGASKGTLMAMAQDINSDLLREKENNNVELTRLQGYIDYMQSERQERNNIGKDAINQLQDLQKTYYQYSPQGISELMQSQYAASNITLDQADNGTETQKQMALEQVLSPLYDTYGAIIERPMTQVINDVLAYAKKNGVSLNQALQDNFLTPLKSKEGYKAYQESVNSALTNGSWTLEPIKDANGNITGYVRINKNTGEVVPYSGTAGAGAGTGVYNEKTGVYNYSDAFGYANQNKLGTNLGYKNNNPGNITDSDVGEVGRNGKFAVFATPEDGFDALMQKIQNAQNGLSKNYPATSNLYEFFNTYAPASDNNDPKKYAESVAAQLGVSPYTKIKDLDTFQFAAQIARHDSGYDASTYGMFRGGIAGVEDHSDNPARSPMYDAIQTVLDSGKLSSTQSQNLQLADIIYRQFYNLARDGSLDHFIESSDFQNIMSQLSKRDFTKAGNDEGASFLKYWRKAIEKEGVTDQTNLRVIRVLTEMIEKKLRKESGAAISSSEWLSNFENYMPQAGESRENKLATMLDWELNIIEPSMRYSGVKDYKWLFSKNSPYYKTESQSGNYYDMNSNANNSKGTWDIGLGTVVQTPSTSGGQFDDLFTMLNLG